LISSTRTLVVQRHISLPLMCLSNLHLKPPVERCCLW